MMPLLRALRLMAIVVWVGGLVFFAFVLAPAAFNILPSTHEAGLLVGATLRTLNYIGIVCFGLFALATLFLPRTTLTRLQQASIVAMFLATIYVQFQIVPAMERDRIAAGGDIDAAQPGNPDRLAFERLHPLSEKVEGTALLIGLGVVVLMGVEKAGG